MSHVSISRTEGGQWVNVFSMAMPSALGRDEVKRSKGQVTPEHYSRPSLDSAGELEESPLQPTHHPACSWEHQLLRGAIERGKGRWRGAGAQLTGCTPFPRHSFTPIHPSHTLCLLSIMLRTFYVHSKLFLLHSNQV